MKVKISAISRKEMPSKFGGTWQIVKVKLAGQGEKVFELSGFGTKVLEKLKAGDQLTGYVSSKSWEGKDGVVVTPTFCKITAEYVYDIVMKMQGGVDEPAASVVTDEKTDGEWETTDVVADDDPGF